VFHMMMRRRELSKTAEGVVGCADDGSGHVPHERGAAVAAANLKMAAAKKMGEEWWHGGKGDDGKRKKKKKRKVDNGRSGRVNAATPFQQGLTDSGCSILTFMNANQPE